MRVIPLSSINPFQTYVETKEPQETSCVTIFQRFVPFSGFIYLLYYQGFKDSKSIITLIEMSILGSIIAKVSKVGDVIREKFVRNNKPLAFTYFTKLSLISSSLLPIAFGVAMQAPIEVITSAIEPGIFFSISLSYIGKFFREEPRDTYQALFSGVGCGLLSVFFFEALMISGTHLLDKNMIINFFSMFMILSGMALSFIAQRVNSSLFSNSALAPMVILLASEISKNSGIITTRESSLISGSCIALLAGLITEFGVSVGKELFRADDIEKTKAFFKAILKNYLLKHAIKTDQQSSLDVNKATDILDGIKSVYDEHAHAASRCLVEEMIRADDITEENIPIFLYKFLEIESLQGASINRSILELLIEARNSFKSLDKEDQEKFNIHTEDFGNEQINDLRTQAIHIAGRIEASNNSGLSTKFFNCIREAADELTIELTSQ